MTDALRLSHSAVEDYLACGEKYRLRRVERVPRLPSWALVGGVAVHEATAGIDLWSQFGILSDGPMDFASAFEEQAVRVELETGIPRSQWRASGRKSKPWPEKENREWWLQNGPTQVKNWANFLNTSPWHIWVTPEGLPAVELSIGWEIAGIQVNGYVDRILENDATGDLAVVDLKSGASTPISLQQLQIYDDALMARWGEDVSPRYGFYFMTRIPEMTPPVDLSLMRDGRLDYTFTSVAQGIRNGVFLPNQGRQCISCDVRDFCYAQSGYESATVERPYTTEGAPSATA